MRRSFAVSLGGTLAGAITMLISAQVTGRICGIFVAALCHPRGLLLFRFDVALRKWADMDGRCELYGHGGINK